MLIASTPSQLAAFDTTGNLAKNFNGSQATDTVVCKFGIFALQAGKPLMLQYGKKESAEKKIPLPEKLACISVSPCENYLIGGAQSGRLYLWSLESGQLVAARDAHFQRVSCIAWSQDSAVLASGGDDARVLVWKLFDLLTNEETDPQVLTSHSLEILDVHFSKGRWREARLYTSAKDSTLCVHHLSTFQRLFTLTLDSSAFKFCLDSAERAIYAASSVGVSVVSLYTTKNGRLQAVGGNGAIVAPETVLLETKPSALQLSEDATLLYVGETSGVISVWNVGTHQLVKSLKPLRGEVEALFLVEGLASLELPTLQRTLGDASDIILPQRKPSVSLKFAEGYTVLTGGASSLEQTAESYTELAAQVAALEKKNAELQALYDKLWAENN